MRVLVIFARNLSCGYLGCYGNEWVATPTLDQLAAEGIVFDQHYAADPDPLAVEQVWQTGCYHFPVPPEPGPAPAFSPPFAFPLLLEHDVCTSWITASPPLASQGWHTIQTLPPESSASPSHQPMLKALAKSLKQLATQDNWLLRVDLATLLPPWHVPKKFRDYYQEQESEEAPADDSDESLSADTSDKEDTEFLHLQDEYAAAVTYLDHGLGQLLEIVAKAISIDDLLLLVTTDQGQVLSTTGRLDEDTTGLHEELIHLPLLMRLPQQVEAGRRIAALTQPCDLLPTLLEAFGLPLPVLHGKSLLPLVQGRTESIRAYACAGLKRGERLDWALRTPEWGFRHCPQALSELFVKPQDRHEVNDVALHHLEFVDHLARTLHAFVAATRQAGPLLPPELPREEELAKVTAEEPATPPKGESPP